MPAALDCQYPKPKSHHWPEQPYTLVNSKRKPSYLVGARRRCRQSARRLASWLWGPSAKPLHVLPDRLLSSPAGRMNFSQTVRLDLTSWLNGPNRPNLRRWLWQRWLSSRTTPVSCSFIIFLFCHRTVPLRFVVSRYNKYVSLLTAYRTVCLISV